MKRYRLILLVFLFLVVCAVVRFAFLPKKPIRDFYDQIYIGMSRNEVETMLRSYEHAPAYTLGYPYARPMRKAAGDRWYDDSNVIDIDWENGKIIDKELWSKGVPTPESWLDKLMRRFNK